MFTYSPLLLALLTSTETTSPEVATVEAPAPLTLSEGIHAYETNLAEAAAIPSWASTQNSVSSATGDAGWYINLGGALTSNDDSPGPSSDLDFENGFALIGAVGYHFGPIEPRRVGFELEGELVYTDQDVDRTGTLTSGSEITILAGFINGVADFPITEEIGVYAGAGVGVAALDIGNIEDGINDFDEDDGPFFAWQVKGGLRWRFNDNMSLNLGYRFLNVDDAEIDDDVNNVSFDLETAQHMAEIGLRWSL